MQQPASQPMQPQKAATEVVKQQPAQPISVPNKELGPMTGASVSEQGVVVEQGDDEEEIKVSAQEMMLGTRVSPGKEVPVSEELKEAGVEQGADTDKEISMVVQRAGMRVTSSDSLVPESAIPTVKLPINYAHALQLDKRSKIKDSIKWFARYIKRQWEKMRMTPDITKTDI